MKLNILYEDNDMIVCVKPVGVAAQNDRGFGEDMVSILMNYQKENGVKSPYVGVIHRLDKMVGGVMVYAKTKEAAASLSRQIQEGKTTKRYYAVLCGEPDKEGTLEDYLVKDGKTNTSNVSSKGNKQAKIATLNYKIIQEKNGLFLAEIELLTGRHHQIRVQFSSRSWPLYGDAKYNKDFNDSMKKHGIGLYSYLLGFKHPKTGKYMKFINKPDSGVFSEFNL